MEENDCIGENRRKVIRTGKTISRRRGRKRLEGGEAA